MRKVKFKDFPTLSPILSVIIRFLPECFQFLFSAICTTRRCLQHGFWAIGDTDQITPFYHSICSVPGFLTKNSFAPEAGLSTSSSLRRRARRQKRGLLRLCLLALDPDIRVLFSIGPSHPMWKRPTFRRQSRMCRSRAPAWSCRRERYRSQGYCPVCKRRRACSDRRRSQAGRYSRRIPAPP